jgi:hypothetical protein
MTDVRITAIVEGDGECQAVPVLIRRIAREIDPVFVPVVLPPIRIPASKLVKEGELERAVQLAALKLQGRGGILIVLDCDDGCPAQEGPRLLCRAQKARNDYPISVVLAKKEYESWFLAASASLANRRGLPARLEGPPDPEAIRDAKGWLTSQMPRGFRYSETRDQAALTAVFDMVAARQADSFDKLYREVHRMLSDLGESG